MIPQIYQNFIKVCYNHKRLILYEEPYEKYVRKIKKKIKINIQLAFFKNVYFGWIF